MTIAEETMKTLVQEAIRMCGALQTLTSSSKRLSPAEKFVAADYMAEIKDRLSKLEIILGKEVTK